MTNVFMKMVRLGVLLLALALLAAPAAAQELDEQRKATKRVEAVFPPIAKRARLSGTVKMVVVVTAGVYDFDGKGPQNLACDTVMDAGVLPAASRR